MDRPLISIIIPVYNAEKTIGRAINSILTQTSLNFELLLINDGSIDDSLSVMKEFVNKDSRVKVFSKINSGVSNSRNYGIQHAMGKYITFLDADDYYVDKGLEMIMSEINDKTQLAIFGYNLEYENKSSNCIPSIDQCQTFSEEENFRESAVALIENEIINAPWNKVYLSSYLKSQNILFTPDLEIGEDLKFNLSVIKDVKHVKIFNNALVNYTVKKGEGLVSKFRYNRFELRYALLIELKELLTYWGKILENQAMIDRMLIRDIMAYFMDFYKSNCSFSNDKKLELINELISRKEIKEIIAKRHDYDLLTNGLQLILRTNNCRFILLSARLLNLKRVMR